jgi:hypothetical protein
MAPGQVSAADPTSRAMLSFLRAVGARPHHEVYFSTPITTGETFVQWRRGNGMDDAHPDYQALHHEHVIARNLERVAPIVVALRAQFADRLVIDPTGLDAIDDWTQPDYHAFWSLVVERYASRIVFSDGWQYSTGCVTEFVTALRHDIPMFAEDMAELTRSRAIELLTAAIDELVSIGEDPVALRRHRDDALRLIHGPSGTV